MDEGGNTNDSSTGGVTDGDARRIATWSALATHMTPSIQRVVEFAKRVPGKFSSNLECNLKIFPLIESTLNYV